MTVGPWLRFVRALRVAPLCALAVILPGCTLPYEQLALPGPLSGPSRGSEIGSAAQRPGVRTSDAADAETNAPRLFPASEPMLGKPPPQAGGAPPAGAKETADGITLNLSGATIQEVASTVLGDVLKLNYAVADNVKGSITLRTAVPIPKADLLATFESLIRAEGAALVVDNGIYRIVAAEGAAPSGLVRRGRDARSAGLGNEIVALRYVAAEEMQRILSALAPQASILKVDQSRNVLIVSGTANELSSIRDTVATFDVDWMRGMSFGLFPVESVQIVRRGAQTISQQKSSLSIRVEELSRTLAINRFLQRKVTQANQRAVSANEQFLRQIGAELHDGPAQLISLGLLRLDGLRPRAGGAVRPPEAVEHDFSIIRGALADSLKEVRSICAGMTIPELNDCTLAQAIELSVTMHERRSGSTVALDLDDRLPDGMPLPFVICAYRFVQEGLNNAFKHAGGAGQRVSARMAGTHVVLTVSDSGPGITSTPADAVSGRLGLRGLSDRIRAMGGELDIRSASGEGTHLEARFNVEDLGLGHD